MKENSERNYFGEFADEYADEIMGIQPQFYKNAAKKINMALSKLGANTVLDVGNGGVINYRFRNLKELRCIDLEVSEKARNKYKKYENIVFQAGNIFELKDIPDKYFDAIIIQTVIHHLAGNNVRECQNNVLQALESCKRVLKDDGQILIVESVVKPWFEALERIFYSPMQFIFRIIKFDRVYQFSKGRLYHLLEPHWKIEEFDDVAVDKYIWLMRKKVLSKITPCRAAWYLLGKR